MKQLSQPSFAFIMSSTFFKILPVLEINSIEYSETPVNITHICKMLNAAAKVEEKGMRKLTAVAVNDALAEMGVVKITSFNNKRKTILRIFLLYNLAPCKLNCRYKRASALSSNRNSITISKFCNF